MTSLSDVLRIATSGLQTAQTQVTITSDNISNVNTPGYARKVATQQEIVADGYGLGVKIAGIQRATNQFMQQASFSASAQSSQASVISTLLDQAQSLFGDPSDTSSIFASLDSVYSAFSNASATPSSSITRSQAVGALNSFLSSAGNLSDSLQSLQTQTGQQLSTDVNTVNGILKQLSDTNANISRITVSGGDATGLQNNQEQLLNQLSGLMQIQVQPTATGGVVVRSADGAYLAGDQGPSTLAYTTSGTAGVLTVTPPNGASAQQLRAGTGEIAGLMQMGNSSIPQVQSQLSEYVSKAVDQINAAHNASSALPPPNSLTGTSIGMGLTTAITGFSGKTTIAVTDPTGVIQQRVDITFANGTGTMSVNGGAPTAFTAANFLTSLNTALGSAGSASFSASGALSITAANPANGVAIADDPTTPSQNTNGEGFSQFFGLNNLVQASTSTNYNTGLASGSPNTFATGGVISLQLADATGAAIRQASFTIPATATTVGAVIAGLNTAVGAYGSFSLDAKGALTFTAASSSGVTASVINDTTVNSAGGPGFTTMFGLDPTSRADRASSFSVRADIAADPSKLAMSELDLTQPANGLAALGPGDGRGALAIAQSGSQLTAFAAAGDAKAGSMTISDYGAQIAGLIGTKASNADNAQKAAAALSSAADTQRQSVEGVNLDDELVNLTTYQQSYNACSRLVQASSDMFNTLLQMI